MESTAQTAKPLFTNRDLTRLMIPLVIEQLLLMTVGMADTMMVTTAGEAVVSGVSLVDGINILIINIFSALSTGGAVVVAQYLGRREPENARSAAKQLLYVALLAALFLMGAALLFREHILRLLFGSISQEVMDSALIYFLLTAAAYPFIAIYNAGAALFRAMGNSKVSMVNSLIVNLINIAVNAVLIYGFGMGAAGAGIGTLVSRIAAAVIIGMMITRPSLQVYVEDLFRPNLQWRTVKAILGIGIPAGIENGMFQIGKLLVLRLVTSFDLGVNLAIQGSAVAANAICNSVASCINVPGQAVGLSMVTVIGQCMGAGDHEQAVGYTKKLMKVAYLSMGLSCLCLFLAAPVLVPLFNLTTSTAAIAIQVLRWCAVFTIVFWPMAFTLPNALRAAGDAKFTMVVSMLSMWICRIGMSYLLGPVQGLGMGLLGVWVAMFCDWVVRAALFLTRFLRGKWKEHQVI
ncbi:MAG: MATE family efflux transporter [Oscillospiraceae bacterium]|nr:MATE family efflux transporter [Oscillospiraceae bacterium]